MGILKIEECTVSAMFGVQLKVWNKAKDLMPILDLNETMDQLAMANIMH